MEHLYNYYDRPMQTIGQTSLISDFIKHLLANTWIPVCQPVSTGDTVVQNNVYIYNHQLIVCTQSGRIGVKDYNPPVPPNNDYEQEESMQSAQYEVIDRFIFGNYYNNLTYRHQSKYDYYDGETHKHLGQYLRCINKIYGVNYLPFYNCFYNTALPNLTQYYKDKYLYVTPIEFNKEYTISYALDNAVKIKPILYAEFPIDMQYQPTEPSPSVAEEWNRISQETVVNGRHYGNYVYVSYNTTHEGLYKLDKYLYLLISSSEPIKSLAVVEGHFENTNNIVIGLSKEKVKQTNVPDFGDFDVFSKLKLLSSNDSDRQNHYAFSNRLVEGLLHHTINVQDEVQYDIGRVQEKLGMKVDNIWQDTIKQNAFSKYMATYSQINENVYFDISGNIDKEIEYYLFGNNIST